MRKINHLCHRLLRIRLGKADRASAHVKHVDLGILALPDERWIVTLRRSSAVPANDIAMIRAYCANERPPSNRLVLAPIGAKVRFLRGAAFLCDEDVGGTLLLLRRPVCDRRSWEACSCGTRRGHAASMAVERPAQRTVELDPASR